MTQHKPATGLSTPTAEELEAQLTIAPPQPAIQPLPKVQPRAKKARTGTRQDEFYYDVNDGTIKPEPTPEPPRNRTRPASFQAPSRTWD
jgi:hypothetical protein